MGNIIYTDVLVVGAGVAGLRAACEASRQGAKVIILNKGACASPEIMGFDVVNEKEDTVDCFYNDLRACSGGISRSELTRTLAENSVKEIPFLESIGMEFDKNEDGSYHAKGILGSTYPRLVHSGAETGIVELRLMHQDLKARGVEIHQGVAVTDIIVVDGRACGAVGIKLNTNEFVEYSAKAVILATGGCGAMQSFATYPSDIVGDGYSIAYRAGAELVDMEFQQFEPCCFVYPEAIRGKVVPTTLLRIGAKLVNSEGEEFMPKYGLSRETVRKGELARAIATEVREGRGTPHGGVYYDCTMMPRDEIVIGHSIFYEPAIKAGLDMTKEPMEMHPACHTMLGGVCIDENARTCVEGLFAAGEVTGGVYGADRIGGCMGAETLVFGHRAGAAAAEYLKSAVTPDAASVKACVDALENRYNELCARKEGVSVAELRERIGKTLSSDLGIFRDKPTLEKALREIDAIEAELANAYAADPKDLPLLFGCENMIILARMQAIASLMREESRGVFYRVDFPERDDANWTKNIVFSKVDGELSVKTR